jgi:drug/metabolite transporter (DMT)-like permease
MKHALTLALAVSLWGTWPLWLRASPMHARAKAFWVLVVVGGLALLFHALVERAGRKSPRANRHDLWLVTAMGVAGAVNQLTYFASLELTHVARAALSHYVAPILVASLAPLVLRERLEWRVPIALAAAMLGLVLLLGESAAGHGTAPPNDLLGITLALSSAVFYAAVVLCGKRLSAGLSPLWVVGTHCSIAALVCLPYVAATTPLFASPREMGFVTLASVAAGLLPTVLFFRALAHVRAQHAAVLTYLEPLVAALLAWAVYGESLGAQGILGGVLVLAAGVFVVVRRAR